MLDYKKYILILMIGLIVSGCTKEEIIDESEDPNPAISLVPEITLEKVNGLALENSDGLTIQEYSDSLVFTINYIDGNGDIGFEDPDLTVVELVDNRNEALLIFEYHVYPRAPIGAEIVVQGKLDIVLKNIILLDSNNSTESTTFSLRLKDRALQWSNIVESKVITITQ